MTVVFCASDNKWLPRLLTSKQVTEHQYCRYERSSTVIFINMNRPTYCVITERKVKVIYCHNYRVTLLIVGYLCLSIT